MLAVAAVSAVGLDAPVLPHWNDGAQCEGRSDVESAWLDADTAILRESLCVTAEAPFAYLLFGTQDALLIDSGDGAPGFADAVRGLMNEHATRTGRSTRRLVVAHTHAHGDHVRGDSALRRAGAIVVGLDPRSVAAFFGIARWPETVGALELGGRRIVVLPIPGHEASHVAFHDPSTGILLTGDTLYPGRLYVPRREFRAYEQSVRRLQRFAEANNVDVLMGAHVEMSRTPGVDYPAGARVHRGERALPLTRAELNELVGVLSGLAGSPREVRRDRFILAPL
jgi:hydroxyacylglutathione hydrolase